MARAIITPSKPMHHAAEPMPRAAIAPPH